MAKGKVEYWLTSEGLTLLNGWAREGLTDEQIAHNCGIKRQTIYDWKKKYPDISDALKKGKEIVDYEVENALLKRAKGYRYKEITKEQVLNPITNQYELKITKEVEKEVVPDTGAAMAWLKNRKPDKWKDKQKENIEQNNSEEKEIDSYITALNDKAIEVWNDVDEE